MKKTTAHKCPKEALRLGNIIPHLNTNSRRLKIGKEIKLLNRQKKELIGNLLCLSRRREVAEFWPPEAEQTYQELIAWSSDVASQSEEIENHIEKLRGLISTTSQFLYFLVGETVDLGARTSYSSKSDDNDLLTNALVV